MVFVANDQTSKVMQPREQPLDLPASVVAAKGSAVLSSWLRSVVFVGSDQFHPTLFLEPTVQRIAVVGLVADHARRQFIKKTSIQRGIDQGYFMRASAACVNGERKTLSVCKAHDFGAFAPFGLAHASAPFFAGAKVPSMKPSLKSIPPRSRKSLAKAVKILSNTPDWLHCWNRRWQVLRGGYRSGRSFQGAPVRRIQRMPLSTSRRSCGGRPDWPGTAFGLGINLIINRHCSSVRSINPISTHHKTKQEVLGWALVKHPSGCSNNEAAAL